MHARYTPFQQRFSYGLFMVDVDVDRVHYAETPGWAFGMDRSALYSLQSKDHGDGAPGGLRAWAESIFDSAGLDASTWSLRLVTFPRHVFYRFAPLSVWFASDEEGALRGVIYEVNNTFGESHAYVAPIETPGMVMEADKRFHVSPFFDVTGKYRFTLRHGEDRLGVIIDTLVDGERTHMASLSAKALPATAGNFVKASLMQPLSALGVTLGIHYEALKLWGRGAKYRPKPIAPQVGQTLAQPSEK